MKLYPPEAEIVIYEEGFGIDDLLNRKPTGITLSHLVERIEDPLVIVVNGPWGSGKSYFLRRWVGAHTLENEGRATTVYFDAFAHDFLDDPLTALASEISPRLPQQNGGRAAKAFKSAVAKLAKPVTRIALAVGTAGVSEVAGAIGDAALAAGQQEAEQAVERFWQREEGKRAAMRQLEQSLRTLTVGENPDEPRKLVTVVDELDRCRPDYALAVLEIIKHFFSVPHVHFVLGVNMAALEHSVHARYGDRIDAEGYLRRFYSLSLSLPHEIEEGNSVKVVQRYLETKGREMGLPRSSLEALDRQLSFGGNVAATSIRDANKILSLTALLDQVNITKTSWGRLETTFSLLIFKALNPVFYDRVKRGKVTTEDIKDFYGITPEQIDQSAAGTEAYSHSAYIISGLWRYLLTGEDEERGAFSQAFGLVTIRRPEKIIKSLASTLDVFSTPPKQE